MTQSTNAHSIPLDILDDLCSRFIINIPQEEKKDLIRVCFQIELAHWFYLDFYCVSEPKDLKPCSMREFAAHIFQHLPSLNVNLQQLDEVLGKWHEYKQNVPTYGAILLDEDMTHVLLVQSFYSRASWGFPKGKVNEQEDPVHCAVREVMEEIGYDISKLIDKNEYLEATIHEQLARLYIVRGIKRDTKFQPRTRNEIKSVEWFCLEDLPTSKKEFTSKTKLNANRNTFFMAIPFVKRLKRWIAEKQQKNNPGNSTRRHRNKSVGDVEPKNRKQQHQFSQSIQLEMQDYEAMKQLQKQNCSSPPQNARKQENSRGQKPNYKRQLFSGEGDTNIVSQKTKDNTQQTDNVDEWANFRSPSWQSFKFDRASILACLDVM